MPEHQDRPMALAPEMRVQLLAVVAELEAGDDVSPARSFSIETRLQQAWVQAMRAQAPLQEAGEILREYGALRIHDNHVELQLWQRRAPVVPTTAD